LAISRNPDSRAKGRWQGEVPTSAGSFAWMGAGGERGVLDPGRTRERKKGDGGLIRSELPPKSVKIKCRFIM